MLNRNKFYCLIFSYPHLQPDGLLSMNLLIDPMKCPYCEGVLTEEDFFELDKSKKVIGKKFKGKEVSGSEKLFNQKFAKFGSLTRFWVCPHCDKLLHITDNFPIV